MPPTNQEIYNQIAAPLLRQGFIFRGPYPGKNWVDIIFPHDHWMQNGFVLEGQHYNLQLRRTNADVILSVYIAHREDFYRHLATHQNDWIQQLEGKPTWPEIQQVLMSTDDILQGEHAHPLNSMTDPNIVPWFWHWTQYGGGNAQNTGKCEFYINYPGRETNVPLPDSVVSGIAKLASALDQVLP